MADQEMTLFDTDYGVWLEHQITALRLEDWSSLDIPHLLEELEVLNKSNKRELYSYLVVLLAHLIKWQYQPLMRSGSWDASIGNSHNRIERLFKDQPSLKVYLPEILSEAFEEAKEWAHKETKLDIKLFPQVCPYTVEQLLDSGFLPD